MIFHFRIESKNQAIAKCQRINPQFREEGSENVASAAIVEHAQAKKPSAVSYAALNAANPRSRSALISPTSSNPIWSLNEGSPGAHVVAVR
jgi:hypothetical protein